MSSFTSNQYSTITFLQAAEQCLHVGGDLAAPFDTGVAATSAGRGSVLAERGVGHPSLSPCPLGSHCCNVPLRGTRAFLSRLSHSAHEDDGTGQGPSTQRRCAHPCCGAHTLVPSPSCESLRRAMSMVIAQRGREDL